MATGNTSLLKLALPVEGELDGTWGDVVNDSITSLLDSSVAGTTTLSTDADVTLTDTALSANQARQAILLWTASNGATTRNITAPARSKPYIVINAGTGSIVVRGAGPTTGTTVIAGEKSLVAWNGSDFAKIGGDVTLTGSQTLTNKVLTSERETAVSLTGTAIDLTTGNYFYKTVSADTTFTVTNPPASNIAQSFILELTNAGSYTVTWFAGLTFPNGTPPTLTASGRDVLAFFTRDGGTTWSGFVVGKDLQGP